MRFECSVFLTYKRKWFVLIIEMHDVRVGLFVVMHNICRDHVGYWSVLEM